MCINLTRLFWNISFNIIVILAANHWSLHVLGHKQQDNFWLCIGNARLDLKSHLQLENNKIRFIFFLFI